MRSFYIVFVFLLSFISTATTYAQLPLTEYAEVTLLTCGPGDELYSVFGHTAIRVSDPGRNMDIVYNFGSFDFDTPNFYLKFVKGDLQYFVSVSSYTDFINEYEYLERTVYEQHLNLLPEQKQQIADELNTILLSDRRFYTYKFIDRNCTTMVADIIADNIESEISTDVSDKGKTNREILFGYLDNHFYENLGISLMFGYKTDKLSDKLFLPQELMEGVANTTIKSKPLAKPAITVNEGYTGERQTSFWNSYYSFVLLVLLLLYLTKYPTILLSYLTLSGLLGIFFLTVGFYSFHDEITQNYNALLFSPVFLLLVYFILAHKAKATIMTVYICLALLLIYIIFILNKPHLFIMLPLIVLHAVAIFRIVLLQKKSFIQNKPA